MGGGELTINNMWKENGTKSKKKKRKDAKQRGKSRYIDVLMSLWWKSFFFFSLRNNDLHVSIFNPVNEFPFFILQSGESRE